MQSTTTVMSDPQLNLTIYKASAGSGKTFRLAYEFIKHVLARRDRESGRYRLVTPGRHGANRHRAILAITFTNKATEEMKRRIVRELAVLAGAEIVKGRKSDYREMLIAELGCSADELHRAAVYALQELLYDFNFFNVSTIDAFFQNVLRVFAREAELNGNYEVELNDSYAIETGVNDMLDLLARNQNDTATSSDPSSRRLIAWLRRYMNARIDDGKAYNLFNHTSSMRSGIVRFIESLTHEDYKYHREQILHYIDNPELMERFEAAVTGRRKELRREISELSRRILAHLAANPQYPEKFIERSLMALFTSWAEGSGKMLTRAQTARIDGPESGRFVAAVIKQGLYDAALDSIMLSAMNSLRDLAEIEVIAANLYNLGIFGHVLRQINNFRQDNNLVLLSDTNTLLRDIIGSEATPFIYERVGMWLRHFLIDEFQDTSNLQWDILRPLVATSVAEGNDNLIIGDEKQCIYRFRNSDPTLLQTKVPDEFTGRVRQEGSAPGSNVNYRSTRQVVEFNNRLFSTLARQLGVTDLYSNVEQNIKRSDHNGYVCMTGISAGRLTSDFQAEALRIMCTHMARQLQSGYSMADIAILVRSNSEADMIVKYLMNEGKLTPGLENLQVLSDEALHIRTSSAVQLIVNDLRRFDPTLQAGVRPGQLSADAYNAIIHRTDSLRASGMEHAAAVKEAIRQHHEQGESCRADETATRSDSTTLFEIVDGIIAGLPEALRLQESVFITAFQDLVIDFGSRNPADITSFLQWWDSQGVKACLSSVPGVNAVRIMTIHKSKGLEFPCVHIPMLSGSLVNETDLRWYSTAGLACGLPSDIIPPYLPITGSKDLFNTSFADEYQALCRAALVDELNVLYVAFTRAVSELIVQYRTASKPADPTSYPVGWFLASAAGSESCEHGHPTTVQRTSSPAKTLPTITDEPQPVTLPPYQPSSRPEFTSLMAEQFDGMDSDARRRGVMMHSVLAQVHYRSQIPVAVRRLVARGRLPHDSVEEITAMLMDATARQDVLPWFEGFDFAANEHSIFDPSAAPGEETHRPDRIVIHHDGSVDVIDYKFGEVHTAKYHRQVQQYMALASRIYPGATIRGFIWYLPSGHIDTVTL